MSDAPTPETFRLFIAVTVPEDIKTEIEKTQATLRRVVPKERVRWTKREQFHLTLKFLGNVDAQRVEPLMAAVRAACRGFAALELRAERVGFFPNLRAPRVVWAGVNDRQAQLPSLQQAIEAATCGFTAEVPEKTFTGHVTLGRIKGLRRTEADALADVASSLTTRVFGAWTTDKVELIRSQLSPAGAQYTTLAGIPLTSMPRLPSREPVAL
jgi:RNA 2',3'-cyclic 3'-phosphodiesterase